jgi:hypothetical protein
MNKIDNGVDFERLNYKRLQSRREKNVDLRGRSILTVSSELN